MERIGLFGGTFDPIHNGHLRAAVEIREAYDLDRVELIVAAAPPHKGRKPLTAPEHRLEMARLAIRGTDGLFVSDVEAVRSGPSYTIDTVRGFRELSPDSRFFLIVGLDAFLEIHTWKSHMDLFREIPFIVMTRPGAARSPEAVFSDLHAHLSAHISEAFSPDYPNRRFSHERLEPVYLAKIPAMDVSATDIRQKMRAGRSIRFLTPGNVEDYMVRQRLYK